MEGEPCACDDDGVLLRLWWGAPFLRWRRCAYGGVRLVVACLAPLLALRLWCDAPMVGCAFDEGCAFGEGCALGAMRLWWSAPLVALRLWWSACFSASFPFFQKPNLLFSVLISAPFLDLSVRGSMASVGKSRLSSRYLINILAETHVQ